MKSGKAGEEEGKEKKTGRKDRMKNDAEIIGEERGIREERGKGMRGERERRGKGDWECMACGTHMHRHMLWHMRRHTSERRR